MKPVNTRRLFLALLGDLGINTVCDVGSMNGEDALAFRLRLPHARILALEPNPSNLDLMRRDPRMGSAGIEIISAAASNAAGRMPFFVVNTEYHTNNARRGMSSLHCRDPVAYPTTRIEIDTVRLDGLLSYAAGSDSSIALWIDAEGHACEVLEGLQGVADRIAMLHIELESEPCIAQGQRLYPEALARLASWNFREIATDHPHSNPQFNALFLRDSLDSAMQRRVATRLWRARLRRRLVDASQELCPACLRRVATLRSRVFALRTQRRFTKHPASGPAT